MQMKIILGSENRAKKAAVQAVFTEATIMCENMPSLVRPQPLSDEETLMGATNRAIAATNIFAGAYGVGLEGGVMFIQEKLYLCNWAAICTPAKSVITAAGARIALPDEFILPLQNGTELSVLMDKWANKQDVRHKEGAIGIFTNGEMNRSQMFIHTLQALKGQLALCEEENE